MDRPLAIGLTGGIGSGKSVVAKAFMALGAPVICTDTLARELVEPGQPALTEITTRFGAAVLLPDGSLDRAGMRQRVFADAESRRALEAILHPRIRDAVRARLAAAKAPYVVVDIPLLVETGAAYRPLLDRVLVVMCAADLRRQRVMLRDGASARQVDAMLAAQANDEMRQALADDTVVNEGSLEELADRVAALDRKYRMLAGG
ncbi:MAG: dephospho-CoA kinase [Burkholderiales bacterium]|nr:dephospho-CoA kinase [Burkholderiales bacterium]